MRTKWKYLRDALLGNFIFFLLMWFILANVFILGAHQDIYAFGIALYIYALMSIHDTQLYHLQDRIEELEKQKKFDDKYKQFML